MPALVTLRVREGVPSLRTRRLFQVVWDAFVRGRERRGGRLVHFSVQSNHFHLIVEADDEKALARYMAGLQVRLARAVNKRLGRTGSLFSDRYHARVLASPTQVRRALGYVLQNDVKHHARRGGAFDLFSSAPLFDGWSEGPVRWPRPLVGPPPCVPARAWLLREGWRRAGPLSLAYSPGRHA